jgi:multiple sugar transport system ATP-binding protein
MGSELYAYFDVEHGAVESADLSELAADAHMEDLPTHGTGDTQQVVARLSAASRARPGGQVHMLLDTTHLQLFDPKGGKSLTVQ